MSGRVITIHLVEGSANGLQTVEIDGWIGEVFVAPKTDLATFLQQPELQGLGVYVLVGDDPQNFNQNTVYIGQGQVKVRLTQHVSDQDKDYWDGKTIAIIAKDNSLNTADCHYLESRLIELARKSGTCTVKNIQKPAPTHLVATDKTKAENFLAQILVLLPVLNIDYFAQSPTITPTAASYSSPAKKQTVSPMPTSPRFVLKSGAVTADAELVNNKFIVLKGSLVNPTEANSVGKSNSALRSQLKANEKITSDTSSGKWVFSEDVAFNSPSAAAAVICGFSIAGPQVWKIKNTQQTYGEWQQAQVNSASIDSEAL